MSTPFTAELIRNRFPALQQNDDHGQALAYFDGPGGTQVTQGVIDAISSYLVTANANTHAPFLTSQRTDKTLAEAHTAVADMLNAESADEIIFGPNMTTLTFSFSRALARNWRAGDEVIVTRLDHDANVAPWLALQEQGIVIRWLDFDEDTCRLKIDELDDLLNERTKLIAAGGASNSVGTVNPIKEIVRKGHAAGAQVFVDAVHLAPHFPIDVQDLGCDYLACSAYKFYGPHIGMLWGRYELLDQIPAYKVRPSDAKPPGKWMTGTQNHEGLAGTTAAIDYLASIGDEFANDAVLFDSSFEGRRLKLKQGLSAIATYERTLFSALLDGLESIKGVRIYGITDRSELDPRAPTAAVRMDGYSPLELSERLAAQGIATYAGHFYAVAAIERLGLIEQGGVLRIGISHYNTREEVERLLNVLDDLQ